MTRIFAALVGIVVLSSTQLEAQEKAAIGRCIVNKSTGAVIGKIIAIAEHPVSKRPSYKVTDQRNGVLYIAPEIGRVASCSAASDEASTLVGQCVYNRSDSRFLGRVIRVEPDTRPGQKKLVVALVKELREAMGQSNMDVTFPRNATLKKCSRGIG